MKKFILLTSIVVLSACSNLSKLRHVEPTGSAFDKALAAEYLSLADSKAGISDWIDSSYFARKGLNAAEALTPSPELPETWDIEGEDLRELKIARGHTLAIVTGKLRNAHPEKAARLQRLYDCWVEQAEDHYRLSRGEEDCKKAFHSVHDEFMTPIAFSEKSGTSSSSGIKPTHTIFFDLDSSAINREAEQIIDNIITTVKRFSDYSILLEGHSDRSGSQSYNMNLSNERAQNVKQMLINNGLKSNMVNVKAYGEKRPTIATGDGVKESKNRRVEVQIIEK